jgi:hypothetical protein
MGEAVAAVKNLPGLLPVNVPEVWRFKRFFYSTLGGCPEIENAIFPQQPSVILYRS